MTLLLRWALLATAVVAASGELAAAPRLAAGGGATLAGPYDRTPSFEVTYSPLGYGLCYSAGMRMGEQKYAYGELGFGYLLTVGGGLGRQWGTDGSAWGAHFFLGLPIPLLGLPGGNGAPVIPLGVTLHGGMSPLVLYLEPYYRPQFSFSGSAARHERGILLKVSVSLSGRDWREPPVTW